MVLSLAMGAMLLSMRSVGMLPVDVLSVGMVLMLMFTVGMVLVLMLEVGVGAASRVELVMLVVSIPVESMRETVLVASAMSLV